MTLRAGSAGLESTAINHTIGDGAGVDGVLWRRWILSYSSAQASVQFAVPRGEIVVILGVSELTGCLLMGLMGCRKGTDTYAWGHFVLHRVQLVRHLALESLRLLND